MAGTWKPKYKHICGKCGWAGTRSAVPRECPKCNHWCPVRVPPNASGESGEPGRTIPGKDEDDAESGKD